MIRILKAFAWLRFRVLVNSLEKTGSRDTLERFSIAIERLGPIIAAILLVPSAIMLGGLGTLAGWTLIGDPEAGGVFTIVRYLLLATPLFAIVGPLVLPSADRTNPVRLLLLPIPRHILYVAQSSAALGDPWTLLMVPLALGVGIGLAAAGAIVPALLTLAAALVLVTVIVALSALTTSVLHLIVRNRRRGEMLALIALIVLPAVAMLPGLLASGSKRERGAPREPLLPAWAATVGTRAMTVYPTELFVAGARAAAAHDYPRAGASLAALTVTALALHGLGLVAFRRVLDSPGSTGSRRSGRMNAGWGWQLPGLSRGASAVATAQLRLAMRTPRGRSIFLSPFIMLVIFGILVYRAGAMDFGFARVAGGMGLAVMISAFSLLAVLPIAMNQFAVDRAGFTMTLLSPLSDREVLLGKAAGIALIAGPTVVISMVLVALAFQTGSPLNWITLILALVSVYVIAAPVAAILSAILPREVDMNSIGKGSQSHSAAGLLGLLAYVAAGVPPALLTFVARVPLSNPPLAPIFVLIWCAVAVLISRALFRRAERIYQSRRENLAMLVS